MTVLHDPSPHAALPLFGCESRRWRRSKEQAGRLSMLIREHMLVHWDQARASTGHELPGPLPADEVETDPATGATEQGAS